MTSGNLTEEPIAKDNDEAVRRLSGIVDYFLVHNRDIYARYDDSVTIVEGGIPRLLRRARGYAPYPIHLGFISQQILGCGAEEKNTFCLTRGQHAFLSQHIGDMENLETIEHFENTVTLYQELFRIKPVIVAHDLHPDYLTTKYAQELAEKSADVKLVPVQHHHAHIVSGMVDNGLENPVIGVALDGTGYGTDGNIWGGEFMVADYQQFSRMGHLEYLPLVGGATAIKKPYRIAIGYLQALFKGVEIKSDLPCLSGVGSIEVDVIRKQIDNRINAPLTSSCGRLFDAVSALIGVRSEIEYEGQAAIELEMLAYNEIGEADYYPFFIARHDGLHIIKLQDLFAAIICDLQDGITQSRISARFHNTIARIVKEMCIIISEGTGIKQVVLSGGVFQNRIIMVKTVKVLQDSGFAVFNHRQVPCNDGGISLGQVAIANFATPSP
jgi:hydrogenase maturation protein HypF